MVVVGQVVVDVAVAKSPPLVKKSPPLVKTRSKVPGVGVTPLQESAEARLVPAV